MKAATKSVRSSGMATTTTWAAIHSAKWFVTGVFGVMMAAFIVRWFENDELADWTESSWTFAKQIMPLLFAGVLVAGLLLGGPEGGHGVNVLIREPPSLHRVAYGIVHHEVGVQAARIADRILRGGDPATIPVETADFYLTVNLAAADRIGLDLTEAMLQQADAILREDRLRK